ncbi:hypothetical protein GCM10028778_26980 [Barrientosiimonas marina]|uniref:Uncharacterized protein n=1 Tax=Lentibacillus kimchii TaxID=1542911 RepID=A0ABW2UVU7_9BACI
MENFFIIIAVIVLLGLQVFLSKRKSIYFGAILPVGISVVWLVWVPSTDVFNYIIKFLLIWAVFGGIWLEGREALKKRRKRELDKITTYDMK